MRLSKREKGNASRSTLEELLRGNIAGLPEVIEPTETVPEEYAWATTDYLYDITQEYYQVIQETTTSASGSTTTAYVYGLERIVAYSADSTTSYVYDGRGSVVQAITAPVAGNAVTSALPDVTVQVQSLVYTAFGEQMGSVKVSGFAYNAEAYDAATGMMNLRARQYESNQNRFFQKDVLIGNMYIGNSFNRYIYVLNCPVLYKDSSGMVVDDEDYSIEDILKSVPDAYEAYSEGRPYGMENAALNYDNVIAFMEAYYAYAITKDGASSNSDLDAYLANNFPGFVPNENMFDRTEIQAYVDWYIALRGDYDSNCASSAATAFAVGDTRTLRDLLDKMIRGERLKFDDVELDNSKRDIGVVSGVAKILEEDRSFFDKVEVTTTEELDNLMASNRAKHISVCVMTKKGGSGSLHMVVHKRTVLYNGRIIVTYVGASNNRNDIPYDYALQNYYLTFYLNYGHRSSQTNTNSSNLKTRVQNIVSSAVAGITAVVGSIANTVQRSVSTLISSKKKSIKKTKAEVSLNAIQ